MANPTARVVKSTNPTPPSRSGRPLAIAYACPSGVAPNAYVDRCKQILLSRYRIFCAPKSADIARMLLSGGFRRYEAAISNWEDNWIAAPESGSLRMRGMLHFAARMLLLRLVARKVVYVRHNRYPHHVRARHAALAKLFLDFAERLANCCVTHSPAEAHGVRRRYVPHPLYFDPKSSTAASKDDAYFVVFGRLLPYKGLEGLIAAFPPEQRLVIAGPADEQYAARLRELVSHHPNIELRIGYLPQDAAASLVSKSMAMIISNAGADMIVSGSYFFALSCATPVIAIENEFFRWSINVNGAPGLIASRSMDALVREIANFIDPDRNAIASYAARHFSDEAVLAAWSDVVEGIDRCRAP